MTPRSILFVGLAVGLLSAPTAFAGNDKLAGKWVRNSAESEWRGDKVPVEIDVTVEGDLVHLDQVIQTISTAGQEKVKLTYEPGREYEEHGERKITDVRWKGAKLVVKFDHKAGGMDAQSVETWKIKGKQLQIKYSTRLPVGTFVQKNIYDRAE